MTALAPRSRLSWPNKTRKDKLLDAGAIAYYQTASQMATGVQRDHTKRGQGDPRQGLHEPMSHCVHGRRQAATEGWQSRHSFFGWEEDKKIYHLISITQVTIIFGNLTMICMHSITTAVVTAQTRS